MVRDSGYRVSKVFVVGCWLSCFHVFNSKREARDCRKIRIKSLFSLLVGEFFSICKEILKVMVGEKRG